MRICWTPPSYFRGISKRILKIREKGRKIGKVFRSLSIFFTQKLISFNLKLIYFSQFKGEKMILRRGGMMLKKIYRDNNYRVTYKG